MFTLDLTILNKAMQITGHRQPMHLINKNQKVRLWNQKFAYTSNAQIIRTSKLLIGIRESTKNITPIRNKATPNNPILTMIMIMLILTSLIPINYLQSPVS